ncbi:MAG TPA: hypothetical protein EYN40_05615 [Planctomycetes bacterium]|nr:hypothetical protein [Planctomycetota bacterium]
MNLLKMVGRWWNRWRLRSRARSQLRRLFGQPARLVGTSLRQQHLGRCDVVDIENRGDEISAITFQILRHPRPHPFSRQHHLVAERWRVDLPGGTPQRAGSVNLSRLADEASDGAPPGSFP